MIAEREGVESAKRGSPYGSHAEPEHEIEHAIGRHAAHARRPREQREIPVTAERDAAHVRRYGAGF